MKLQANHITNEDEKLINTNRKNLFEEEEKLSDNESSDGPIPPWIK